MASKRTYLFIASVVVHLVTLVVLKAQVAAPPVPDPAAQAAPLPAPTDPSAQAAGAVPAVAPAAAAPVVVVPPPVWPDTVQVDEGSKLVDGDGKPDTELFGKSQDLVKQSEDIVAILNDVSKQQFDAYITIKMAIEDFSIAAEDAIGQIKESNDDQKVLE